MAVVVVGSVNVDTVIHVARNPLTGETTAASRLSSADGGKGLNQARAAAGLTPTALIASVGADADAILQLLDSNHVNRIWVRKDREQTGQAFIWLTPHGENTITVAAGANNSLSAVAVDEGLNALSPSVVLTQAEIPAEAIAAAADWCRAHDSRFIVNASPTENAPSECLAITDPLIVLVTEARQLTNRNVPAPELAELLDGLTLSVVVTDGAAGAWLCNRDGLGHIPTPMTLTVDTTGAGDTFAGVLAANLAQGSTLSDEVNEGAITASAIIGVTRAERYRRAPSKHSAGPVVWHSSLIRRQEGGRDRA